MQLILFDMDGVLLEPRGYHQALRDSVRRIGHAIGAPNADLTTDQIARLEALNITNEWDSVAICTALTLCNIWQHDPNIRVTGLNHNPPQLTADVPDFDEFLNSLPDGGTLPGKTTFDYINAHYPWINPDQRSHLAKILLNCRDIYTSLTAPIHQEAILGSTRFHKNYNLQPQLDTESYLTKFDRAILTIDQHRALRDWLVYPDHHAGIMTNRLSQSPPGFLGAPEAELGVEIIGMSDLPYIGSGTLGWYAVHEMNLPGHALQKPNPMHASTLMLTCLGKSVTQALKTAESLCQGNGNLTDWQALNGAELVIFEDSAKGLISAKSACSLLSDLGLQITLKMVGVSNNPFKRAALEQYAAFIIKDVNQISWTELFL